MKYLNHHDSFIWKMFSLMQYSNYLSQMMMIINQIYEGNKMLHKCFSEAHALTCNHHQQNTIIEISNKNRLKIIHQDHTQWSLYVRLSGTFVEHSSYVKTLYLGYNSRASVLVATLFWQGIRATVLNKMYCILIRKQICILLVHICISFASGYTKTTKIILLHACNNFC